MATASVGALPSGFVLDQPAAGEGLPPGFVLDQPSGGRNVLDIVDQAAGFTKEKVADAQRRLAGPPSEGTPFLDKVRAVLGYGARTTGYAAREARRGVAMLAGAPVDIATFGLNAALPARAGGRPFIEKPVGGSESVDRALGGFGLLPEPAGQPDPFQRIIGRIAQEAGANALPVGLTISAGRNLGVAGARALANAAPTITEGGPLAQKGQAVIDFVNRLRGKALEAAAVDPAGLLGRETGAAVAAGTGAGLANEAVGNPQHGDNFKSDFTGSLLGLLTRGAAGGIYGVGKNVVAAATSNPKILDNFAQETVAANLIANSARLQSAARAGQPLDTAALVEQLRTPSRVEEAVPGFQANIGDRAGDPGLSSFAFNTDARLPGAQASRLAGNEAAVEGRLAEIAPEGNAGQFRSTLENARTQQIADAQRRAEEAATFHATASQGVQPALADATARGSSLRAASQQALDVQQERVQDLFEPFNVSTTPVDISPLIEQVAARDARLSPTETRAFRPAEAQDILRLAGQENQPTPTGLLDAGGKPILRAPEPAPLQPLRNVTGARSGLSERLVSPTVGPNEKRVVKGYREDVDQFIRQALSPEQQAAYEQARAAHRDVKERFLRPGTALEEILRRREGGGYQLDPSAAPGKFAPTNQGRIEDFRALMREAGADPRARGAVADQILTEARQSKALENPQALSGFLADRSIVLSEMPEVRRRLENAGFAKAVLDDASKTALETEKRLTQPGQSATASFLKFGDERQVDAIRTVTNAGKPAEAARELIAQAGGTAEARAGLRDAFWQDVRQSGKDSAKTGTGGDKWNGRKLNAFLNDPKKSAVAEELWSDRPEDLANIHEVFGALAGAEGSTRMRSPGSSGTAQALAGKFDPALSMGSLASRARSVERGVLSPQIAIIDVAATYIRKRKAQVQERAIDTLAAAAVNDPELAATLLEKFNPVDWPAKRRMLTQKYGVRGTQVGNLLDEAQSDETIQKARGR